MNSKKEEDNYIIRNDEEKQKNNKCEKSFQILEFMENKFKMLM